ncbi:1-acyl-sn-glycerol-3-phosphate acyltransferase [Chitiniphilus purpureus]|uniref:1-acyl-sn-glycerol-3-phosphate acyltransferase n=1 Tax=Chitiniphilus purpureus TaxID=2981137 RepID=A0ABY6DNR0_9NEIS|nr:1-acyl-sn-glycerol-3-phosphate acyltransferase [Chitiniphilus sp. CD1]UXY16010.1 1-acyl-sn-glycerol-3-phosphate acyltransferase [Chitiniphilus sp. CD1]
MMPERLWRICATALCFAGFALACLVVALGALPLVPVLPRQQRQGLARQLVHHVLRVQVRLMCATGAMSVEVHGAEKLARRGLFIVANHPSLIDVTLLMALTPYPDCIVKAALCRNPITFGPVYASGFISNADGPGLLRAAIDSVAAGNNLILFPEGTRTPPGARPAFQRGAANIAVRGGLSVTPVLITCSEPTLPKGAPWYRVPRRRPHFVLHVLDDVPPAALLPEALPPSLGARLYTRRLEQFFIEEIARHGPTDRRDQAFDYREPEFGGHGA